MKDYWSIIKQYKSDDESIDKEFKRVLQNGETIRCHVNMGSCQCGSFHVDIRLKGGVVWIYGSGGESWMNISGPAEGTRIKYAGRFDWIAKLFN